jgi:hypothetical protein
MITNKQTNKQTNIKHTNMHETTSLAWRELAASTADCGRADADSPAPSIAVEDVSVLT